MLIKKVTVKWDGSYGTSEFRILFYDQDGNLFESGDVISNNISDGETENFKVTYDGVSYSPEYYPAYVVSTTTYKDIIQSFYAYWGSSLSSQADLLTIEFKTIKQISKIKFCTFFGNNPKRGYSLNIYDIFGNKLSYDGYDTSFTIHEYDTKIPIYNINEVGIVETTINTNIQEIQTVRSINVDYEMPDETEIRMALSNDDRNTYKIFDGSNWITIDKNDVVNNGM